MALVGLILILVLVFTLLLHGHSNKYKACGTGMSYKALYGDNQLCGNIFVVFLEGDFGKKTIFSLLTHSHIGYALHNVEQRTALFVILKS